MAMRRAAARSGEWVQHFSNASCLHHTPADFDKTDDTKSRRAVQHSLAYVAQRKFNTFRDVFSPGLYLSNFCRGGYILGSGKSTEVVQCRIIC